MSIATPVVISAEPGEQFVDEIDQFERQILGWILLKPSVMNDLSEELEVAHFRSPLHQAIYTRLVDLYGRSKALDAASFMQAIMVDKTLAAHERRVVLDYVHKILNEDLGMGVVGNLAELVTNARENTVRRLAGKIGMQLQTIAPDATPEEIEEALDKARDAVTAASTPKKAARTGMGTILETHLSRADNPVKPVLVPSPYADLNQLLDGGLYAGQMTVIAGRPSMGKSVVGLDIAREAAKNGSRVLWVSLEMLQEEIAARFLAATASVPLNRTKQIPTNPDVLTDEDWRRISKVHSQFAELDERLLVVDPSEMGEAGFSVVSLRRHLVSMKKLGTPADFVVLDYLGLLTPARRGENRQTEVAEMSRAIKMLAIEFRIPIVAIHQLNRESEKRMDKRPQVSDLRESGAVEQDADVVILLHREDAYEPECKRVGEMDLIVGKNRNGSLGVVAVSHQFHYSRAADMPK